MRHVEWLLRLVLLLTVTVGWLVFVTLSVSVAQNSSKGFCKYWCEDVTKCGPCELIGVPPICGQEGCRLWGQDPDYWYTGQCTGATGPQRQQWVLRAWWDCDRDGKKDCECRTWTVKLKM